MLDSSLLIKAGFGNLTQWSVALKGGLVNETFHPKYLSRVLPPVFSYAAGGPAFEPWFVATGGVDGIKDASTQR